MDKPSEFSNHEIVTMAAYLLGGATRPIDTEDIAIKANALAPGRFCWRKYKDQISLDAVRKRLWDAKSEEEGYCYVKGSERDGWMLTEAGCKFVKENIDCLENVDLSAQRKSHAEKSWARRERVRMLSSVAYRKFCSGQADDVTAQEAASFFRVDEYVTGDMRERKLLRIINEFGTDAELGDAIAAFAARVRGENDNA